jgi:alpha-beta hydrolase superfamily lysophospholipase
MPLSFAILGSNRADGVIKDHPEVTDWVIAGPSLGGDMAARYVANHLETIGGLALWGPIRRTALTCLRGVA